MSVLRFAPTAPLDKPKPNPAACTPARQLDPVRRVAAAQIVEKLRGATEPTLVRADDGALYVVKLTTNPLGRRVLVNEYLGTRLARAIGLPTPDPAIIAAPAGLALPPGQHFGSRVHNRHGNLYAADWLPAPAWGIVENARDLIGALALDAWVGNAACRQVVFLRAAGLASLRLLLIDNGRCFGGATWCLRGLAAQRPAQLQFAYAAITGWHDLEPWLSTIERLKPAQVRLAAEGIPPEWLPGAERSTFMRLLAELDARRMQTRAIIAALVGDRQPPFTNWRYPSSLFVAPLSGALGKTA